jgi:hypothetical protein
VTDDPRFRAIWTQLKKLWVTQDTGTPEDVEREHTILTTLVAEWQKHNEP